MSVFALGGWGGEGVVSRKRRGSATHLFRRQNRKSGLGCDGDVMMLGIFLPFQGPPDGLLGMVNLTHSTLVDSYCFRAGRLTFIAATQGDQVGSVKRRKKGKKGSEAVIIFFFLRVRLTLKSAC